ncbi:MAG: hypothetical protein ACPHY8_03495 [Patescibacteria group bacterium]
MVDGLDGHGDHGELVIPLLENSLEAEQEVVQILLLHEVDHIVVEVLLLLKQEIVL